jgi:uncharacterized membrane protein
MEAGNEPHGYGELRREIELLKDRLARVEQTLKGLQEENDSSAAARHFSPPSVANAVSPKPMAAEVVPKVVEIPPRQQSLERRIGSQLFNRVGIVAVLFAMGWFLKLAIDREWIGPATRVSIGLLLAIGLVFWSERFRRRSYFAFAYSLKALGTGLAYLSLWAAATVYFLMPPSVAFACMVAVTAANGTLAWVQGSELLAGYATLGGNITPMLLPSGQSHEVFLFSYLLLLDIATALLLIRRNWTRLIIPAFISTTLYFFYWGERFYQVPLFAITVVFLAAFFLCFACIPIPLIFRYQARSSYSWLRFWPIAVSLVTWMECLFLSSFSNGSFSAHLASFSASLALASIAFTLLPQVYPGYSAHGRVFIDTHLLLATSATAIAILFGWQHFWIVLGWLFELLLLTCFAIRFPWISLRVAAGVMLLVSFVGLVLLDPADPLPEPVTVMWNAHFGTYLFGLLVCAAVVSLALRGGRKQGKEFSSWARLAGGATIVFNITALIAGCFEIHHYWSCGDHAFGNLCKTVAPLGMVYTRFSLSAWLMLYGAGLMTAGFLVRRSFLRWQALILLLFSVGKVFLYDAGKLNQGYRVLSFLVLGVLLLAVSYAYQRDILSLRAGGRDS